MQKLPIGISEFTELRKEDCTYVDKTKSLSSLLTENRRTCLSRPRRFGKSLLVSTLEAALQGKKALFKDLWIAKSSYSWPRHGTIRLDFSQLNFQSADKFEQSLLSLCQDIGARYGIQLDPRQALTCRRGCFC